MGVRSTRDNTACRPTNTGSHLVVRVVRIVQTPKYEVGLVPDLINNTMSRFSPYELSATQVLEIMQIQGAFSKLKGHSFEQSK